MRDPSSLVIDYGGTWIRVTAFNRRRRILHKLKEESFYLHHLPSFLGDLYKRWKIVKPETLILGARGVWKKNKKYRLWKNLRDYAEDVRILSDVEMTYQSIFGDSEGILLIVGTGSICYGRDYRGRVARAGGLGPKKGDEGSGYWIGRKYLELSKRNRKKITSVRQVASLAPMVIKKAESGDAPAQRIVREAYEHLAHITIQCANKLRLKKKIVLCFSGGLFQNRFFKNGFKRFLRKKMDKTKIAFKHPLPVIPTGVYPPWRADMTKNSR